MRVQSPDELSEPVRIRAARAHEAPAIRALLAACDLPVEGAPEDAESFFVAARIDRIVGCAGLERHGADGLLRSLAVAPELRAQGLAAKLCAEVERRARELGARQLFLLTETAEAWFHARGYRALERSAAPRAIAASREFAAVCPAAAVLMARAP